MNDLLSSSSTAHNDNHPDPAAGSGGHRWADGPPPIDPIFAAMEPRGIIDTVRIRILKEMNPSDVDELARLGFRMPRLVIPMRILKGRCYAPTLVYTRKRDGVKVIANGRYTSLEFSVPRVLLGSNAYVSAVRPWAALALVGRLCAELLPGTTSAGAAQGASWTVQRVDLAVDFAGFARGFVEAYRVMRTRRVRAAARGVWYLDRRPSRVPAEALMWAARRGGFAVIVYVKSAEVLYRRRVEEARRRPGPVGAAAGPGEVVVPMGPHQDQFVNL